MSAGGKQYGNFDLKYMGAIVSCNTATKIESLKDYITQKKSTFYIDTDNLMEEQQLDAFFYNSVYFHESRHVHDYILSPALNYLYRLRISSVHNSLLFSFLLPQEKESINTIPVPLSKWIRLSPQEKKYMIDDWKKIPSLRYKTPDIYIDPEISIRDCSQFRNLSLNKEKNSLHNYIIAACSYHEYFEQYRKSQGEIYGIKFTLQHLIEASAFIMQTYALYGMYGGVKVNDFISNIDKNRSDYTLIIGVIQRYLTKNNISYDWNYLLTLSSVIINWCFWGDVFNSHQIDHPIYRLIAFIDYNLAKDITLQHLYESPLELFTYWNRKLEFTNLNVQNFVEYNLESLNSLKQKADIISMDDYSSYIKMFSKASVKMMELFLQKPENYLIPELYIKNMYSFINVPVRFEFNEKVTIWGATNSFDLSFMKNDTESVKVTYDSKGNAIYSGLSYICMENPVINPYIGKEYLYLRDNIPEPILNSHISYNMRTLFTMSDTLFNDSNSNNLNGYYRSNPLYKDIIFKNII